MKKADKSITTVRQTGCGSLFVTLVYGEKPINVRFTLGKSGGCASAELQALQGCLNHMIKNNVPIDFIFDKEDDNSWINLRCSQMQREDEIMELEPESEEDERTALSCPDVAAKTIRYLLKKLERK